MTRQELERLVNPAFMKALDSLGITEDQYSGLHLHYSQHKPTMVTLHGKKIMGEYFLDSHPSAYRTIKGDIFPFEATTD